MGNNDIQAENRNIQVNSKLLLEHIDDLDDVFRTYYKDIHPMTIEFQSIEGTFPTGVLNEIRAIYAHLVRAALADNEEDVVDNIKKIKGHTKRALLDCYKYTTLHNLEYYNDFMKRYQGVDLTYLDRGEFLSEITKLFEKVKEEFQRANESDLVKEDEAEQLIKYETACQDGIELVSKLKEKEKDAAFLKRRARGKDILSVLSFIVGIVGVVLAIVK